MGKVYVKKEEVIPPEPPIGASTGGPSVSDFIMGLTGVGYGDNQMQDAVKEAAARHMGRMPEYGSREFPMRLTLPSFGDQTITQYDDSPDYESMGEDMEGAAARYLPWLKWGSRGLGALMAADSLANAPSGQSMLGMLSGAATRGYMTDRGFRAAATPTVADIGARMGAKRMRDNMDNYYRTVGTTSPTSLVHSPTASPVPVDNRALTERAAPLQLTAGEATLAPDMNQWLESNQGEFGTASEQPTPQSTTGMSEAEMQRLREEYGGS